MTNLCLCSNCHFHNKNKTKISQLSCPPKAPSILHGISHTRPSFARLLSSPLRPLLQRLYPLRSVFRLGHPVRPDGLLAVGCELRLPVSRAFLLLGEGIPLVQFVVNAWVLCFITKDELSAICPKKRKELASRDNIRFDDSLSPSLLVAEKAKPRWLMAVRLATATARTAPETAKLRLYMLRVFFVNFWR